MSGDVVAAIEKGILGTVASGVGWFLMFPLRSFIKSVKAQWQSVTKQLGEVHTELTTQRTNCLTTLQKQGDEQIKLLGEMTGTLREMHLDQRETLGIIRARE